jgi:hypothetical protein
VGKVCAGGMSPWLNREGARDNEVVALRLLCLKGKCVDLPAQNRNGETYVMEMWRWLVHNSGWSGSTGGDTSR